MILAHRELVQLVETGAIKAPLSAVQGSSIDVTLGDTCRSEKIINYPDRGLVNIRDQDTSWDSDLRQFDYLSLSPGQFVLSCIKEELNLPLNISAQFMLKSSVARSGLEHSLAGWIDAGFQGIITLELKNNRQYHNINLRPNDPIGQIVFFRHEEVPLEYSYKVRGQYQGDTTTQPSRGAR